MIRWSFLIKLWTILLCLSSVSVIGTPLRVSQSVMARLDTQPRFFIYGLTVNPPTASSPKSPFEQRWISVRVTFSVICIFIQKILYYICKLLVQNHISDHNKKFFFSFWHCDFANFKREQYLQNYSTFKKFKVQFSWLGPSRDIVCCLFRKISILTLKQHIFCFWERCI